MQVFKGDLCGGKIIGVGVTSLEHGASDMEIGRPVRPGNAFHDKESAISRK